MKLFKRILKIILISAGIVFLLVGILALFTQTDFFKERLRVIIASSISTRLNGTLHLGKIDGNFLKGFSVDSLTIDDNNGTVLSTGKITCVYDLFPIYQHKLQIDTIIIERPVIHFLRPIGHDWNISTVIKPSNDSTSGSIDWTALLNHIEIKNGSATLCDSASLAMPDHWDMPATYFEYHHFSVHDLNFKMHGVIDKNNLHLLVEHLGFVSPESQFTLLSLNGEFSVAPSGVSASNIRIRTGKSSLDLSVNMKNLNLFSNLELADLEHDTTHLTLLANDINLNELKSFLPQISFLEGSAYLELKATGEFGNLAINSVNVKTYGSTLHLSGLIKNLHAPERLFLDVRIDKSTLNPADATKLLAGLQLPHFGNIGSNILDAQFTGEPVNFTTKVALTSPTQHVEATGSMNLNIDPAEYNFSFATTKLDLMQVFEDPSLQSSISSHGTIQGKGFSFADLTSRLEMVIDSSRFKTIPLDRATFSIDAVPFMANITSSISSGPMATHIDGDMEFSTSAIQATRGNIEVTSFNLAPILDDPQYESSLNLQGKFSSRGTSIDKLNGYFDVTLFPSTFRDHAINPGAISIELQQDSIDNKHLNIHSPLADLSFQGKFRLDNLIESISKQTNNLIETIKMHADPASSISASESQQSLKKQKINIPIENDFHYTMEVKDLDPVASVVSKTPFNAQAMLNGTVKGSSESMSITGNGAINDFFIGTTKGGILLKSGTVAFAFDSLSTAMTLERLHGTADIIIDSGLINTKALQNIRFGIGYSQMRSRISLSGLFDSLYDCHILGGISVQPHTYAFDFDSVIISMGSYRWTNEQDVQLRLNYDGLRIMHGVMRRNNEYVSVNGALLPDDMYDITAQVKNFDLQNLGQWFQVKELEKPELGFKGTANFDVALTGSSTAPAIDLTASLHNVAFKQSQIGEITTGLSYNNQTATINANVKRTPADSLPTLMINGTLPINLAFTGVEDRFPDREEHITIKSDRFNLAVIDPLIPDIENLTGSFRCNVVLAGTPKHPQYEGFIAIDDTRFLLAPNNISYILNAELEPRNDSIIVKSLSLKNVPEKKISGTALFTGSISIKDFRINSFNLRASGQLLLMTDATRRSNPNMYGTLFTEISPEGLLLQGTLERPFLSGKLFVKEASLTFPPTKSIEAVRTDLALPYTIIDDTTHVTVSDEKRSRFYAAVDSTVTQSVISKRESPLLERLRYRLDIETAGLTALTMIFTPTTGEELYAELEGKVNAINDQGTPNLYGSIEISSRSYYNFFKRFDATGKLKFVGRWDNPELDILATYEGYAQITQDMLTEAKSPGTTTSTTTIQGAEQKVIVQLKISGTRYEPQLQISMKVQFEPGKEPVDWASQSKNTDVQSDAISFIITGKFKDQLTSSERQDITNLGSSTGSTIASSLISSIFSDALKREFPFVRRAEVNYSGGNFQEGTSVNVSVTPGIGNLRVGGRILNDIGNANISYQVSFGDILRTSSIRNFFFEFQRKVEGENPEDRKLTNEARIFYRFSF
jgi:hypothetical protein